VIGVFGGTFDPIHFGHLRPAVDILQKMGLQQVRFIPCGQPPHREMPLSSAALRLAMVQAAIAPVPEFMADDREIRRQGPSYMVDTLESLWQEFEEIPLCLILGRDAFNYLPQWHRWQRLLDLAHIVVMSRPLRGTASTLSPQLQRLLETHQVESVTALQESKNGGIYFCEVTQLAISATKIRAMVNQGRNPAYLLPETVLHLIQEHKLYR